MLRTGDQPLQGIRAARAWEELCDAAQARGDQVLDPIHPDGHYHVNTTAERAFYAEPSILVGANTSSVLSSGLKMQQTRRQSENGGTRRRPSGGGGGGGTFSRNRVVDRHRYRRAVAACILIGVQICVRTCVWMCLLMCAQAVSTWPSPLRRQQLAVVVAAVGDEPRRAVAVALGLVPVEMAVGAERNSSLGGLLSGTHALMHTRSHRSTYGRTHASMHAYVCARTHTCEHTCTQARAHAHTSDPYARTHVCTLAHTHARTHAQVCVLEGVRA